MSTKKNVSVQVDEPFAREFDRTVKQAQIEGTLPMDVSRAEAIRRLMQRAIDDPSLLD